jgi:hypothetical protein
MARRRLFGGKNRRCELYVNAICELFPPKVPLKFLHSNEMPRATKHEQHVAWFERHVWYHPTQRATLMRCFGDTDVWLKEVPNNLFPTSCRTGQKKKSFVCAIRKIAREHCATLASQQQGLRQAARPEERKDNGPQLARIGEEIENGTQAAGEGHPARGTPLD